MEKVKMLISVPRGSKWKPFKGDTLPQNAIDYLDQEDAWRSRYGCWLIGCVWYVGETPETATDWVVITDDGGYYKVGAQFCFWHPCSTGKLVMHCAWSMSALKKNLKHYFVTNDTLLDPGYQT